MLKHKIFNLRSENMKRDPKNFWYNPKLYRSKQNNKQQNEQQSNPNYVIFIIGVAVGFYIHYRFF